MKLKSVCPELVEGWTGFSGESERIRTNQKELWIFMTKFFKRISVLTCCLALSVLVHVLSLYTWRLFGTHHFAAPVNRPPFVLVDLVTPDKISPGKEPPVRHEENNTLHTGDAFTTEKRDKQAEVSPEQHSSSPEQKIPAIDRSEKTIAAAKSSETLRSSSSDTPRRQTNAESNPVLLGKASDFLATKSEKFTYQISMFGIPIGNAELEATNDNGEILITLRVKSNAAISNIYPVDNIVETRHVNGKFILTKIRQQEGSFKSDEEFTINLRKKRVSSFSNSNGRNQITTVPTDEVLDTLSGLYYLRNRQLQVGNTEFLHVFDSEVYEDVPVEILRKETVRLPNFTLVDTIVIQPLQKSAGIFRRTGDLLIWMTDDGFKVPVKIVTSVVLGRITAELVSSESTPLKEAEE